MNTNPELISKLQAKLDNVIDDINEDVKFDDRYYKPKITTANEFFAHLADLGLEEQDALEEFFTAVKLTPYAFSYDT